MRDSIIYLKDKLSNLSEKYSHLKIRYEYREIVNTHIVEVLPLSSYFEEEYITNEIELENEFSKLYPSEEILFISTDSLTEIKESLIEFGYSQKTTIPVEYNPSNFLNKWGSIEKLCSSISDNTTYALAA